MKINRRNFLKGSLILGASSSANAFSFKNPGLDKQDPRYIGDESKNYAMVIDLRACVGCQACTSVCLVENDVPHDQNRTFVTEMEIGEFPYTKKGFLPQLCNHCQNPACVSVCPTGATFKRKDGIVVVDSEVCWGCGYCESACPYDKRYMNHKTKVADKCTFCAHRVDNGLLPACVETCVGGARVFGDLNDENSEISKLFRTFPTAVLKKEQGTKPKVYYIGLDDRLQELLHVTPSLDDLMKQSLNQMHKEWFVRGDL